MGWQEHPFKFLLVSVEHWCMVHFFFTEGQIPRGAQYLTDAMPDLDQNEYQPQEIRKSFGYDFKKILNLRM